MYDRSDEITLFSHSRITIEQLSQSADRQQCSTLVSIALALYIDNFSYLQESRVGSVGILFVVIRKFYTTSCMYLLDTGNIL